MIPRQSSLPLVSIITPSLNQGAFIGQTIRSVQAQTYPNIEHIVVDAKSTDGTIQILKEAADCGHVRFISEPDGGMYSGINKGLRMARGDIVAYLNSDDLYLPWSVEAVVARFSRDSSIDFVFGDAVSYSDVDSTGRIVVTPPFSHGFVVRRGVLTQPTVFWKRDLIARFGAFDESLAYVADCDYWMRIGAKAKGVKISEILALERNHVAAKRFADELLVAEELTAVRRKHALRVSGTRGVLDRVYAYFWRLCFTTLSSLRAVGLLPRRRCAYNRGFGDMEVSVPRLLLGGLPLLGRRLDWDVRLRDHREDHG